ncbi:MAG: CPBP family intramembrane metalloprotease [Planctomycetes bacterium]|nr:CPBP family intramembrane metalloprotease [Planctomycetota bacterium]
MTGLSLWVWIPLLALGLIAEGLLLLRISRHPVRPEIPWGLLDCVRIAVGAALCCAILTMLLAAPWVGPRLGRGEIVPAPPWEGAQGLMLLLVQTALLLCVAGPIVWMVFLRRGYPLSEAGVRSPHAPRAWAWAILVVALCLPVDLACQVAAHGLGWSVPRQMLGHILEETGAGVRAGTAGAGVDAAALIVLAVVVAPLLEEFLFRFFAYQTLLRYAGSRMAWIGASLMFATCHLEVEAVGGGPSFGDLGAPLLCVVVPIGVFGFLLQGLYIRTRSLGPGIAAHALNNGIYVAALLTGHADWLTPFG